MQYESKNPPISTSKHPVAPPPIRTDAIDIFVLPHTHDDVGWLSTVKGYYDASVSHILTSITTTLSANPNYRFIWSETKWVEMWWPDQTPQMQAMFRKIVRNGQLEFVGAGWSQSDEVSHTIQKKSYGENRLSHVILSCMLYRSTRPTATCKSRKKSHTNKNHNHNKIMYMYTYMHMYLMFGIVLDLSVFLTPFILFLVLGLITPLPVMSSCDERWGKTARTGAACASGIVQVIRFNHITSDHNRNILPL